MQFINKELLRINELLAENSNLNVVCFQKTTTFGKSKYNYQENNANTLPIKETDKIKENITHKKLYN